MPPLKIILRSLPKRTRREAAGGEPNGRINAKSRSAIKHFQVSQGLVPDGFAAAEMLERLRQY